MFRDSWPKSHPLEPRTPVYHITWVPPPPPPGLDIAWVTKARIINSNKLTRGGPAWSCKGWTFPAGLRLCGNSPRCLRTRRGDPCREASWTRPSQRSSRCRVRTTPPSPARRSCTWRRRLSRNGGRTTDMSGSWWQKRPFWFDGY